MNAIQSLANTIENQIQKVIVGQKEAVRLLLIALITEGHVLLEGVPGLGKTLLARCMAKTLGLDYKRIQFTADLMPSDIVGTQVYDFQRGSFHLVEGPVFTNILLADEINRAPGKTQAALLEAMQERQVSIEGTTKSLGKPFFVIATQNPIEFEGTYPLPEAQLDRFLFLIRMGYPSSEEEIGILACHGEENSSMARVLEGVEQVLEIQELQAAQQELFGVHVEDKLRGYIVELIRATRDHVHLELGASPRAGLLLQVAGRCCAALEGRDYLIPDDIKGIYVPCLRHRVILKASAEIEGLSAAQVLNEIANGIPVPR
ncbi:MAG TPA: MoxR family ATPase [Planctomycetes bacterium]|nr:MoxR family ATPase [Planctomycetota bacterium]